MNNSDDLITMRYRFRFDNDVEKTFKININKKSLVIIADPKESYPSWTALKVQQCPNCPLDESKHPHCPIAKNLVDVIDFLSTLLSYERVNISIETSERNYSKETDLQSASGSLIGIFMVTSGCPVMNKLSPMVRFHLPFASLEETQYRSISMYLLAQYFLYKHGKTPDWKLKNLPDIYDNINVVNSHFCKRLKEITIKDASLNAIVMLDNSAQYINFSLIDQMLDETEGLFSSYLD